MQRGEVIVVLKGQLFVYSLEASFSCKWRNFFRLLPSRVSISQEKVTNFILYQQKRQKNPPIIYDRLYLPETPKRQGQGGSFLKKTWTIQVKKNQKYLSLRFRIHLRKVKESFFQAYSKKTRTVWTILKEIKGLSFEKRLTWKRYYLYEYFPWLTYPK